MLDQSQYCKEILQRYIESIGHANNIQTQHTSLPLDFIPASADWSETKEDLTDLSNEFNFDYASWIGSRVVD